MKYLAIPTFIFACIYVAQGQTTYLTKADWFAVLREKKTPEEMWPRAPYRKITKLVRFDDSGVSGGYMGYITEQRFNKSNGRTHRVERIGTNIRSEEIINIRSRTFTRRNGGDWVDTGVPSRTNAVQPEDDANDPNWVRKPNSRETLYISLGERLYQNKLVSLYEEITRYVMVRTANQSEIHYEKRTRFWIAQDQIVRKDVDCVLFDGPKTSRKILSAEWEADPKLKPFEPPIK
jgi:hypothetical protein